MDRDYTRQEVLDIIEREANERGIPRDDFLRFAYIETGGRFDEHASRGAAGAKGLFQFVPGTAAQYGIAGREFDAVANTDAAAQLYMDNRQALMNRHERDGRPFLSGNPEPDGLDMYMAHQQGAGGYRSIQQAIETGEFRLQGTRANLLNNVARSDIEAITGHSYDEFRRMSDRDMASTFVEYWDTKFDRVRIPEMGIEAVTQTPPAERAPEPEPAAAGIALEAAHAMSLRYDHVQYGFGDKNPDSGRVDCSGWVVAMQNATMDEINGQAGREVFSREDRFSPGYDSAARIVEKAEERSGILLQGDEVNLGALREGMVIGEDNGAKGWDAGRFNGIDHIVMVVRDPDTGELMASQSRGGEGVELSPLDDYLAGKQARGVRLFASDPLLEARELLQEHAQAPDRAAPETGVRAPDPGALLRDGDRGEQVRRLQESLHELGYAGRNGRALALDGDFGANTDHALRAFQRDNGLSVDGVAGPRTIESLERQLEARAAERAEVAAPAADAGSRLDRLMAGQVDPAAQEAWNREVAAHRQPEEAARQEQDAQQRQAAEQQAQLNQGR
ncbi:peptidoglycan-binding protein [Marilutibacter maris]|uniref:Peptidoglycan-binding protein n=1 Tax=Marilutibacter maris TaxID=1605891 RepID=A0A2U9T3V5_9GAMM|nr:peptidoglycan-binding protein [Lysobacter maris]